MLFAGGGTGGHLYPALSVANELRSRIPNFEALFVGTRSGLEAKVIPDTSYPIRFIFSRGVRGRGLLGKLLNVASLSVGFCQALRILSSFKPHLVFGSGGYASAAVLLAASALGRRIVLQEQNSIPGLTNRLLAPKAERIYVGFERAQEYFGDHRGVMVTGNPLRREILDTGIENAREAFELEEGKPVLLVFGGSQGAHSLNRVAVDYLLEDDRMQGIIQTGEKDYDWVHDALINAKTKTYITHFIKRINLAYRAADVAFARAGALSISEIAAVGLPAVLVPYPYAADNHQYYNATALVKAGGALIIEDSALNIGSLRTALEEMLEDPTRYKRMKKALLDVARTDAAQRIADDIQSMLDDGSEMKLQVRGGREEGSVGNAREG